MSNYHTRINRALLSATRAIAHHGIDPVHKVSLSDIRLSLLFYLPQSDATKAALNKIKRFETLHNNSRGK